MTDKFADRGLVTFNDQGIKNGSSLPIDSLGSIEDRSSKDQLADHLSKLAISRLYHSIQELLNSNAGNHSLGKQVLDKDFVVTESFLRQNGLLFRKGVGKDLPETRYSAFNITDKDKEPAIALLEDAVVAQPDSKTIEKVLMRGVVLCGDMGGLNESKSPKQTWNHIWIEIDLPTSISLVKKAVDDWIENNRPIELIDGLRIIRQISQYRESVFSNSVYHVEKDGVQYIYKPKAEQSSLRAQHSPEIEIAGETVPNREACAFVISDFLNMDLIPRTKLVETGSLQEFIVDGHQVTENDFEVIDEEKMIEIASFIHLIGSRDTSKKNIFIDSENKIKLIDNAFSFTEKTGNFYLNAEINDRVIGRDIPDQVLEKFSRLLNSREIIEKMLANYISQEEITAFFNRLNRLLTDKKIPNPYE